MTVGATLVGLVLISQAEAEATSIPDDGRYETVVVASPEPFSDGSFSLGANTASSLPGAAGDPARALENAPGVARLTPTTEGLALWGATPRESRVLLDGVPIPSLFHFGGWRAIVPSAVIANAKIQPAAFAANYGQALGGIVDVTSLSLTEERLHVWAAADLLDTSVGAEVPIGEGVHLGIAGRLGYVDRLGALVTSEQGRGLFVLPAYRDLFAKATVELGPGRRLSIEALGANDHRHLDVGATSAIDALAETQRRELARLILTYREVDEDHATTALLWLGRDRTALSEQWGLVPIAQDSATTSAGVRIAHSLLAGHHLFEVGVDGEVGVSTFSRAGSLTAPPREGDGSVYGAPPGGASGSDTWHPVLANFAPYATAELQWAPFELHGGLRLDGEFVSTDRTLPPTGLTPRTGVAASAWFVEPRLAANARLRSWLSVGAAFGIHHQVPDAGDLSPVFGSPSLDPSRALAVLLSARATHKLLTVESAAFFRRLDHLTTRNPAEQPTLAQGLLDDGLGRSYGVQAAIRTPCDGIGLCALASYTLSRAQRRAPNTAWRLFDFDQTHLVTTSIGYRLSTWFFGVRFRYATGMPRTTVVGAYMDAHAGIFRPILGSPNGSRLPSFVELDGRIERTWHSQRWTVVASLEVLNATNRTNAEEIVYSGDYSSHAFVSGLPLFVLAGLRMEL